MLLAPPLEGQAVGSLTAGGAVIEYDGFLSSRALVVAPAFRFDSPNFTIASQGAWTRFESGNRVIQGNLAAAWLIGSDDRWRLEVAAATGASQYASQPGTGHFLGGARIHFFGRQTGGWLGATSGRTWGDGRTAPIELSAAGWSVRQKLAFVGSATASSVDGSRFLDLLGAVRWTAAAAEIEARVGVRPWSSGRARIGDATTGGFSEVTAQVPISRWLSLSVGGGSYLSDPARRVLGAKYLNAGLRLRTVSRASPDGPFLTAAMMRARLATGARAAIRLEIARRGEHQAIRVFAPGASVVELMADFTDWAVVPLTRIAPGIWEVALPIAPGVHRVNVRLDGGPWIAPAGTRSEEAEFGGTVGVLVVP